MMFKKLCLFFLLLLPFSCAKKEEKKPSILVTIAPYVFVVEQIAGDTVTVEALIPPGMNIHIYEPSPKLVENASKALAWFRIDEPFEKKIVKALQERNSKQKIINLQAGITLLTPEDAIELSPCVGHEEESHDLHTWLSPKLFLKQAELIAETLVHLFPEHTEVYRNNFNQLRDILQNLDEDLKEALSPFKGDALLVSHPAFGYFCKDYHLIQLSVECEGKDPRPKDIEELLKKIKIYKTPCVFLQQGFNNRGAQLLGEKLQLPIYLVDPFAKDYVTNMRQMAGYIAK